MKHYKDTNGNVFAYEDNGSQDYLIGDKVAMTVLEVEAHINSSMAVSYNEVSRAQFFAALIISNLDTIVDNAVMSSGDKLLINDYKNRLTFRRDWPSFITMATVLGKSDADIDALFQLASTQ